MPDSLLATPAVVTGPEVELLLCCARTRLDADHAGRIGALVQAGLDWDHLLALASRHGLLPLLHWNLNAICPDALPAQVLARLREQFQANAWRNLHLTGELVRLLHLLEARGIIAVPFKGPVLAASVYGNLALRQFVDLDILVQERHLPQARDILIAQGYRSAVKSAGTPETAWPAHKCEHKFTNDERQVAVDLHWGITDRYIPFPLDLERLWERLEPFPLAGRTVPNLPPEDLLLILCVHVAKHGPFPGGQLNWIGDLSELIAARPELDWDRVMEQAARLGSQRMLSLGLFLARDLLGTPLPQEISAEVRADPAVEPLAARARHHLFAEGSTETSASVRGAGRYVFYANMRERRRDRIAPYLHLQRRSRPTARDHALVPLPAPLSLAYYLLRPVRLVRDYGLRESIAVLFGKEP